MLEQIYHLISGYVEFQVIGDGARFFTIAAKRGFQFWGFDRRDGVAVARAKPRTYRRLRPVCRRCQVRIKLLNKRGFPFQRRKLTARKGLMLGGLGAVALYWFLSGFVWGVTVSGAEKAPVGQILSAAREQGVYLGADKEAFIPKIAANSIVNDLPYISWAAVNTDGCFVEIAVKEGIPQPEREERQELSNMVASREGEVVEIEAQQGRPEVKLGDTVTAGQLLIAGLYQEVPDPYGPQPEKLYQIRGAARGRVVAETYREFTTQVDAWETHWEESGRQNRRWLEIFGIRLPLGLWQRPEGEVRTYSEISQASLLGVKLPIIFEKEVVVNLRECRRPLDEDQQKTAVLLKLRDVQKSELPEKAKVIKEDLEFSFSEGRCIVSARCRCREDIGELRVISIE